MNIDFLDDQDDLCDDCVFKPVQCTFCDGFLHLECSICGFEPHNTTDLVDILAYGLLPCECEYPSFPE